MQLLSQQSMTGLVLTRLVKTSFIVINYGCRALKDGTQWLLCVELLPYMLSVWCTLSVSYQLAKLGIWAVPACTWDKGEYRCHPASSCDSRCRAVWKANAQPPASESSTALNVPAKGKRERREKLLSTERSSLLAGLVDTQWFSLWFSWMLSHTDKRLCDGGRAV